MVYPRTPTIYAIFLHSFTPTVQVPLVTVPHTPHLVSTHDFPLHIRLPRLLLRSRLPHVSCFTGRSFLVTPTFTGLPDTNATRWFIFTTFDVPHRFTTLHRRLCTTPRCCTFVTHGFTTVPFTPHTGCFLDCYAHTPHTRLPVYVWLVHTRSPRSPAPHSRLHPHTGLHMGPAQPFLGTVRWLRWFTFTLRTFTLHAWTRTLHALLNVRVWFLSARTHHTFELPLRATGRSLRRHATHTDKHVYAHTMRHRTILADTVVAYHAFCTFGFTSHHTDYAFPSVSPPVYHPSYRFLTFTGWVLMPVSHVPSHTTHTLHRTHIVRLPLTVFFTRLPLPLTGCLLPHTPLCRTHTTPLFATDLDCPGHSHMVYRFLGSHHMPLGFGSGCHVTPHTFLCHLPRQPHMPHRCGSDTFSILPSYFTAHTLMPHVHHAPLSHYTAFLCGRLASAGLVPRVRTRGRGLPGSLPVCHTHHAFTRHHAIAARLAHRLPHTIFHTLPSTTLFAHYLHCSTVRLICADYPTLWFGQFGHGSTPVSHVFTPPSLLVHCHPHHHGCPDVATRTVATTRLRICPLVTARSPHTDRFTVHSHTFYVYRVGSLLLAYAPACTARLDTVVLCTTTPYTGCHVSRPCYCRPWTLPRFTGFFYKLHCTFHALLPVSPTTFQFPRCLPVTVALRERYHVCRTTLTLYVPPRFVATAARTTGYTYTGSHGLTRGHCVYILPFRTHCCRPSSAGLRWFTPTRICYTPTLVYFAHGYFTPSLRATHAATYTFPFGSFLGFAPFYTGVISTVSPRIPGCGWTHTLLRRLRLRSLVYTTHTPFIYVHSCGPSGFSFAGQRSFGTPHTGSRFYTSHTAVSSHHTTHFLHTTRFA